MQTTYTLHPWHGVNTGLQAPNIVNVFVEIIPTDVVKYEVDKTSGILKVDRPQRYSNVVPCLYGFIPQTYCGEQIKEIAVSGGNADIKFGDKDPLDICVLTSVTIDRGGILVEALPIGGLQLFDNFEADDKIIAILKDDPIYSQWQDIQDIPTSLLQKIKHYFLTYKNMPDQTKIIQLGNTYNKAQAYKVIQASQADYKSTFTI